MYEIKKFNGDPRPLEEKHYPKLSALLLKTGKFIEVGDEILNISEIKSISKIKKDDDYDLTKIEL